MTPAIGYAQNGHPLVERANATIRTVEKLFRDHWPTSAAIYLKDGKPAETGKLFTNPAMAATYARVFGLAASCCYHYHGPGGSWLDLGDLPDLPAGVTPIWSRW